MKLALDPKIDVSEALTISLAGREYLIPPLMFRQTVKIGPLMPAAMGILNRRAAARAALTVGPNGQVVFGEGEAEKFMAMIAMSEAEADAALRIIAAGLSRAYPGANFDALYDLPLNSAEIYAALSTVIGQTAATQPTKGGAPGEGEAASP